MSQYVFTMNRVSKVVTGGRFILKDIYLSFFPGAKIGILGLNGRRGYRHPGRGTAAAGH